MPIFCEPTVAVLAFGRRRDGTVGRRRDVGSSARCCHRRRRSAAAPSLGFVVAWWRRWRLLDRRLGTGGGVDDRRRRRDAEHRTDVRVELGVGSLAASESSSVRPSVRSLLRDAAHGDVECRSASRSPSSRRSRRRRASSSTSSLHAASLGLQPTTAAASVNVMSPASTLPSRFFASRSTCESMLVRVDVSAVPSAAQHEHLMRSRAARPARSTKTSDDERALHEPSRSSRPRICSASPALGASCK